jgi:hypothetical protein
MLVIVSAVGLGACTFPQTTKMEPVGETQMQTTGKTAPQPSEEANQKKTTTQNAS